MGDLASTQFTPRDGIDYRRLRRLHATGRTERGVPVPPLPPRWGGVHPNPRPLPPGEGEERRAPPVPPLGGFQASPEAVRRLRRLRFTDEGATSSVVPPTLDGWPSGDIPYLVWRMFPRSCSGAYQVWHKGSRIPSRTFVHSAGGLAALSGASKSTRTSNRRSVTNDGLARSTTECRSAIGARSTGPGGCMTRTCKGVTCVE